jgi:hypothetical protein
LRPFLPITIDVPDHAVPPDPPNEGPDEPDPLRTTAPLTTLDLSEIVRESVARASESSPAVVVEVSTPPRLPAVGEAEALAGVLRLLVDNACRQSDAGVTVKAKRGDEGITVHVIDRGQGMDRDHAPEGFEAARTLIALHGGILWAEPLPAGGTRVGFTIPEEPPAAEDFDAEAALEAIRLLERLAAPPAPADPPDTVEEDQAAEAEEPIDLTALAEQAAAEAAEDLDPPIQLEELWPEPGSQGEVEDEPTAEAVPSEVEAPAAAEDPPAVGASPLLETPVETDAPSETAVVVEPAPPPEVESPPEATPEHAPAVYTPPVAAERHRRFVLDPLHPATQMLRGLALDYDPDADDARGRTIRPPRTT